MEETSKVGDCLQFRRVSGIGPLDGWVNVKEGQLDQLVRISPQPKDEIITQNPSPIRRTTEAAPPSSFPGADKQLVVRGSSPSNGTGANQQPAAHGSERRWTVVRCDDGGISVRTGKALSSELISERLALGSVVVEQELLGDRLHFSQVSSGQPLEGWVTVRQPGRDLLVPQDSIALYEAAKEVIADRSKFASNQFNDIEPDEPLESWARLTAGHAQRLVATAAQTVGDSSDGQNLPPLEDLETADADVFIDRLAWPEDAAKEFVEMPPRRKRKILAEAKMLLAMNHEKRQDALAELRRSWPKGPLPHFAEEEEYDEEIWPRGSCFPLSRPSELAGPRKYVEMSPGRCRAQYASAAAQKEFIQGLPCEVICSADNLRADVGAHVPLSGAGDASKFSNEQLAGIIMAMGRVRPDDVRAYLNKELEKRVFIIDGDLGCVFDAGRLVEADYRGDRFRSHKDALFGRHDLLSLTKPSLVLKTHKEFLAAGADIVRTNTRHGDAIFVSENNRLAYDVCKTAAQIAKRAAADATKADKTRPRLVAGVLPPVNRRESTWGSMVAIYSEQVRGLVEGGVDLMIVEVAEEMKYAKAAVFALQAYFDSADEKCRPVIISARSTAECKIMTGATVEAFCASLKHVKPISFGLTGVSHGARANLGEAMRACPVWGHSFFDAEGEQVEFAREVATRCTKGGFLPGMCGGGRGTLPSHISALASQLKGLVPHPPAPGNPEPMLQIAGLELRSVGRTGGCCLVGQRCSPIGSKGFSRSVEAFHSTGDLKALTHATHLCRSQCELLADVIEVCVDSHGPDGVPSAGTHCMGKLLELVANDPIASAAPLMLCSCEWKTIQEGLQTVPGRCIVNGLCMMVGEDEFLRLANECMCHGAAVVVMAIGQNGPAATMEEKVDLCKKAYELLRMRLDFPPEDIILDCQMAALSAQEIGSAQNSIRAIAELRRTCPGVSLIAGVSNLSMAFRSAPQVRDALHSVFLHHAVPAGLNMAIVEVGTLPRYLDLDLELRDMCENVILEKTGDGVSFQKLAAFAKVESKLASCLPFVFDRPLLETARPGKRRRASASGPERRAYWRRLGCELQCAARPIAADAKIALEDHCRVGGNSRLEELVANIIAKRSVEPRASVKHLNAVLLRRACIYGGGVSEQLRKDKFSLVQAAGRTFRGFEVTDDKNEEIVTLIKPDVVTNAQRTLLAAGADICRTNTFTVASLKWRAPEANRIVYELGDAAARAAKKATAEVTAQNRDQPRFVAGILGPLNSGVGDGSLPCDWDAAVECYTELVDGLVSGGADFLEIASVENTIFAKAAIYAIDEYFSRRRKDRLPLLISVVVGPGGRTLSGQTLDAFIVSTKHARAWAVGIAVPAEQVSQDVLNTALVTLGSVCPCWCYATQAGSTAGSGGRSLDPQSQSLFETALKGGRLNLFCPGIQCSPDMLSFSKNVQPRRLPTIATEPELHLCGTIVHSVSLNGGPQIIGQRCNISGGSDFRELANANRARRLEGRRQNNPDWEAAVQLCRRQLSSGASILDCNFDGVGDLWEVGDAAAMIEFLRAIARDNVVAETPVMLSSRTWKTIEVGLQNVQGKCIVNAISLMNGEYELIQLAGKCMHYGAAIVVAAAGTSTGHANFAEKVRICKQSYSVLRSKLDFPAEDIIFDCGLSAIELETKDPNMPTPATEFLDAVAEVRRSCPGVSLMGGISNVSLNFRGFGHIIRPALHCVILERAVQNGMNLAIADPDTVPQRAELMPRLADACEEALVGRCYELLNFASTLTDAFEDTLAPPPYSETQALPEQATQLALASPVQQSAPSVMFRNPLDTIVQATGTVTASVFSQYGAKAHAANNLHRLSLTTNIRRNVMFSSISAYMGQGGSGPIPGASSYLDGLALWERHQGVNGMPITVQWGAIGEIGLRLSIYGDRDVFALYDLGQKLINPQDTQKLERALLTGYAIPEFLAMAWLDDTWQKTLAGESSGGGLANRTTFAEN